MNSQVKTAAKILLIHGYGSGIRVKTFGNTLCPYFGFKVFGKLIDSKNAEFFDWSIKQTWTLLKFLNPLAQLKLFKSELASIDEGNVINQLANKIEQNNYEIIVCHSLGCRLLLEYLFHYKIAKSVKKVVFMQAAVSISFDLDFLIGREDIQTVSWINLWCPWDNALLSYLVMTQNFSFGLIGCPSKYKFIENQFYPLYKSINLHRSSFYDPKILEYI